MKRDPRETERALIEIAKEQEGYFTASQALSAGFTDYVRIRKASTKISFVGHFGAEIDKARSKRRSPMKPP